MAPPAGRRCRAARLRGGRRGRPVVLSQGARAMGVPVGEGSARRRLGRSREVDPGPVCARFRPRLRSSAHARTARSPVVPSNRLGSANRDACFPTGAAAPVTSGNCPSRTPCRRRKRIGCGHGSRTRRQSFPYRDRAGVLLDVESASDEVESAAAWLVLAGSCMKRSSPASARSKVSRAWEGSPRCPAVVAPSRSIT
jgi:hypothetical protein